MPDFPGPRLTRRDLLTALAAAAGGVACRRGVTPAAEARFDGYPIGRLDGYFTPTADFFVRDHFGVPAEAALPGAWRLEISGEVAHPLSLSLTDLTAIARVDLPVTLECAGNAGRNGLGAPGGPRAWGGASTATFQGASLAALLARAEPAAAVREIVFEGADAGSERGSLDRHAFARSVPLEAARSPQALLATGMNGAPLPALHGGPLRVVLPGRYATDSVKWLTRVRAVSAPFEGFYQRRRYRKATAANPAGETLGALRVQCEIAHPSPGSRLPGALLTDVIGVAWGGQGGPVKVEVSADGGQTFEAATFIDPPSTTAWRRWRWTFRPGHPGPRWIVARATDAAGDAQPLQSDEERGVARSLSGPDRIQYANDAVPIIPVMVV
ncbi:MAG TPA: molybdopterin-dependent oxidoreductase [Myxococcales bacterium]|nr:molybdopterin-dependent oxidoreductase [Myxococcales bacterium]